MEYILIVLCLLGSAFFSGTEIAYTSLSKLKIKKERENPRGIQRLVLFIYDHFDNALSTLLIGNNLVNIAATSIATVMAVKLATTLSYSRLPVYEGSRDNIVGILPVNLFLSSHVSGKSMPLRKLLMKPYVFDSNTEISALLQRMRLNKLHMVFVVDENRKKLGIITMEDLLEELVGDIQDESDLGEGLELL